ncbi:Glycolipid 2-alpha-mannosyltransferase 1 [Cyberlindnera fabianii]|uniref:Glycolipid 2-alpha-mannosyltransferase 1 n=1 Tax=Cyberlindnera fabianii TaxID=36022 RepID=A0A1V2LEG6_CYBFA|nr:Glycolipid 2-alpha-mannosyltransferase 1 [Cyberlindnera fabianii]
MLETIQNVEDRFNSKWNYDWVFLNDEPFTDEFKESVKRLTSGQTKFGLIDKKHWSLPDWIDKDRMRDEMNKMEQRVIYGGSESYRHMCRWYSGFYQWHELVMPYKYYWRVEPDVKFFCDVDYDVFKYMRVNKKKYAFAISIFEYKATIPTLFESIAQFLNNPENQDISQLMPQDNLREFILNDDGTYNLCHYWTNFEIADLDVFRSDAYQRYFNHLDQKGGIFYERWGDGPIRSIFASLFLHKDEVTWIKDLGYTHPPYLQCPLDDHLRRKQRCSCDPGKDFTLNDYSCTSRFLQIQGLTPW